MRNGPGLKARPFYLEVVVLEEDKFCFQLVGGNLLLAPRGFFALSKEELGKISNGCGPKGVPDFVPDEAWGKDISKPCDVHDYMYGRCAGRLDELISDLLLLFNLLLVIFQDEESWKIMKWVRSLRALKYFLATALTQFTEGVWACNLREVCYARYIEANIG